VAGACAGGRVSKSSLLRPTEIRGFVPVRSRSTQIPFLDGKSHRKTSFPKPIAAKSRDLLETKHRKGPKHHFPPLLPAMNQPSRTEDDLEHPTWNQNPPFLAPDLTTRQDLNGIANSREHRHGCPGPGDGVGFPNDEKQGGDGRFCRCDCERDSPAPSPFAMSGRK
jgi:hypothetical protein